MGRSGNPVLSEEQKRKMAMRGSSGPPKRGGGRGGPPSRGGRGGGGGGGGGNGGGGRGGYGGPPPPGFAQARYGFFTNDMPSGPIGHVNKQFVDSHAPVSLMSMTPSASSVGGGDRPIRPPNGGLIFPPPIRGDDSNWPPRLPMPPSYNGGGGGPSYGETGEANAASAAARSGAAGTIHELFGKMVWKKMEALEDPTEVDTLQNEIMDLIAKAVKKQQERKTGINDETDFVSSDLYSKLSLFIRLHVESILKECKNHNGEDLLKYFTTQWDQFKFCSKVVDGIFAYLNRHWIKRELENENNTIHVIYTLALVTWKTTLREHTATISNEIIDLIEMERQGITITTNLVKGCVDYFVELGIDEVVDANAPELAKTVNPKLRVYKKMFEDKFITTTESFYTNEASTFLQGNSITEYMKRVERRLNEEKDRCEAYLNRSTLNPLVRKCEEVLITRQLELLQSEFCTLLETHRDEDLGRMYSLCERVEGGLDELKSALEKHIKQQGLEALEKVKEQATNDLKCFVTTLLDVHTRYSKLVGGAFQNESGFVQALDKAATIYINKNCITHSEGSNAVSSSKCPDMLARYCDSILRKSAKNSEDSEMEDLLNQVMVIFKYIEDKDVFQRFYTKKFAHRLVGSLSASDEAEQSMISKLKQTCGFEYTSKMKRMFTDTGLSKETTDRFREKCSNTNKALGCDFNVMVLGANSWPSLGSNMPINLPHKLSTCVSEFAAFYSEIHQGRKLTWIFSHSKGEVVTHGFGKRYSFVAMTPQLAILLLFNEPIEMDGASILETLQIKKEHLIPQLTTLVKAEILKVKEGDIATLDVNTKIVLNMEYSNKKMKVDLTKLVARTEVKQEQAEVHQHVEENRKMVIQAAIVRIMKTRKQMTHSLLMTEVINQLNSRFKPKIPMVKKCIDILIEKEYLACVDGQKDTYEYLD